MACVQKKFRRSMEDIQELLPGIPNHVTLFSIAPKLRWETCNVLQMVSRGWQHAICSRGVYDAKVRSKSTEPFLLLLSRSPDDKIITSLYSCEDGSCRQLPHILISNAVVVDCICLAGRVFVWVTTLILDMKYGKVCWTFDLVGDRKWTQQTWAEDLHAGLNCGYGVLEGEIYRFQDHIRFLASLKPSYLRTHIGTKVLFLPELEVYDRRRNVWTFVTPEPFRLPLNVITVVAKSEDLGRLYIPKLRWATEQRSDDPDLQRHLDVFHQWAAEQQAADPSKTFLTNGVYEPYISEWRRWQSMGSLTTSATDNNCDLAMATQIFHTRAAVLDDVHAFDESFLFCGSKLLKLMKKKRHSRSARIELYDPLENKWKHWKFILAKLQAMDGVGCHWLGSDCVFADNVLWVTISKQSAGGVWTDSLLRSPALFREENDKVLTWIETGFGENSLNPHAGRIKLRPIYI